MSEDKEAPSRIQIAMDASDKNKLRKEFEEMATSCFYPEISNWSKRKDAQFEWFYTKLKNQAEEYENQLTIKNGFLKIAQDSQNSFITQIDQLKAELSRKEEMLKAAKEVIKYSNAHSPNSSLREPYFRAYQTYKTLTNGD